jgi:hypothetical protein
VQHTSLIYHARGARSYFVGSNSNRDRFNASLLDRVYDLLNPESIKKRRVLLKEIKAIKAS